MCGHLPRIKELETGRSGTEPAGWLQCTGSPPQVPAGQSPNPGETRGPALLEPPVTPSQGPGGPSGAVGGGPGESWAGGGGGRGGPSGQPRRLGLLRVSRSQHRTHGDDWRPAGEARESEETGDSCRCLGVPWERNPGLGTSVAPAAQVIGASASPGQSCPHPGHTPPHPAVLPSSLKGAGRPRKPPGAKAAADAASTPPSPASLLASARASAV